MNNPWTNISDIPPYIAPIDLPFLGNNSAKKNLRFEIPPDPYIGNLNEAKVVILGLNPGFKDSDLSQHIQNPKFLTIAKENLIHKANPSFFFFNQELSFCGGNAWWTRILKPIIKEGISKEILSNKIMCIEYFPYHSKTFKTINHILPSQYYSFELVKEAMNRAKVIVIMRSKKLWLKVIPQLESYPYILIKNPRNPVLSPNNMTREEFEKLVKTLG